MPENDSIIAKLYSEQLFFSVHIRYITCSIILCQNTTPLTKHFSDHSGPFFVDKLHKVLHLLCTFFFSFYMLLRKFDQILENVSRRNVTSHEVELCHYGLELMRTGNLNRRLCQQASPSLVQTDISHTFIFFLASSVRLRSVSSSLNVPECIFSHPS